MALYDIEDFSVLRETKRKAILVLKGAANNLGSRKNQGIEML